MTPSASPFRYISALLVLAFSTALLFVLRSALTPPPLALLWLLPVGLATAVWGLGPGVLVAALAFRAGVPAEPAVKVLRLPPRILNHRIIHPLNGEEGVEVLALVDDAARRPLANLLGRPEREVKEGARPIGEAASPAGP